MHTTQQVACSTHVMQYIRSEYNTRKLQLSSLRISTNPQCEHLSQQRLTLAFQTILLVRLRQILCGLVCLNTPFGGLNCCKACFKLTHKCSMGLMSGDWAGQTSTWMSLSCWKILSPSAISNFLKLSSTLHSPPPIRQDSARTLGLSQDSARTFQSSDGIYCSDRICELSLKITLAQ